VAVLLSMAVLMAVILPMAVLQSRPIGGEMKAKAVRGVYEHPAGSGVWWIHYYAEGKRHREKAGRKSDALALYQKRKADARRKVKLPELVPGKVVTFGHLSAMAVEHAETHLKSPGTDCGLSGRAMFDSCFVCGGVQKKHCAT